MAGQPFPVRVGDIELLVDTTPMPGTQPTSRVTTAMQHVGDAFARAQAAIVEIAASTVEVIQQASLRAARPDRLEVEFGLRFSAKGDVIVAGAAGEATLRVKLSYQAKPDGTADSEAAGEEEPSAP